MAAECFTLVRGSLIALGVALAAACAAQPPTTTAPTGELALEWLAQPDAAEGAPLVEVEVRGVGGAAAIRRRVLLGDTSEREARLSLAPGVYAVQLSPTALHAANTGRMQDLPLELPEPSMVFVSAGATSRAVVVLQAAEPGALASAR